MRRHDLAYLRPGAAVCFQCGAAAAGLPERVAEWLAGGRPLVVARQPDGAEEVLLGLVLPASAGRVRLGCLVAPEDVLRLRSPLAPAECLHRLPAGTAGALAEMERSLLAAGVEVGVYGSLAWEALSGESYRHAGSDIDLVCDVASLQGAERCLAVLRETALCLPCGLDGEIRFPDGRAVAWKELDSAWSREDTVVLAKGPDAVALVPIAALKQGFGGGSAHA